MPSNNNRSTFRKRKRGGIHSDPMRTDSEDEDFDSPKPSPKASRRSKPAPRGKKSGVGGGGGGGVGKKKKHNQYDSELEDEISEIDNLDDFTNDEEEKQELGPSGRPVREIRKAKPTNYEEDDSEEIEPIEEDDDDDAADNDDDVPDQEEVVVKPPPARKGKGARSSTPRDHPPPPKKFVITLRLSQEASKLANATVAAPPKPRSTRATSASAQTHPALGGKGPLKAPGTGRGTSVGRTGRGTSVGRQVGSGMGTRRSSRRAGSREPLAQLAKSGKHAELIQEHHASAIMEEGESALNSSREGPIASNGDHASGGETPKESTEIDGIGEKTEQEVEQDVPEQANDATESAPQEGEIDIDAPGDDDSVVGDVETGHEAEDEDDEDDVRVRTRTRNTSSGNTSHEIPESPNAVKAVERRVPSSAEKRNKKQSGKGGKHLRRRDTRGKSQRTNAVSDEDEYREDADGTADESMSSEAPSPSKPKKQASIIIKDDDEEYSEEHNKKSVKSHGKRPVASQSQSTRKRGHSTDNEEVSQAEQQELAEELEDLRPSPKRPRRTTRHAAVSGNDEIPDRSLRTRAKPVDYRVVRPEFQMIFDDNNPGTSTPSKRRTGATNALSMFNTWGPFGGGAPPRAMFGHSRPGAFGAGSVPIDIDSDSSDDERMQKPGTHGGPAGIGGSTGMTPTATGASGLLPPMGQTHNHDPLQGTPANLGKITKPGKQSLADADPLGVATDITFDSVGGLDDKIQQLKEMVQLPLAYPEIFLAKNVTPPRGVLFHGPPGTGKTLMARALAASCSSETRKVTFFMRKGADCLSKWVGEAERQLRLLFEEAKNSQPSIIFFDEIDGLAPVRSSKQDQIHASIVSTLLALMDGMDGRGQVVVIGATNRPDSVDPALRRPGRFDREFYFPLPAREARRKIIDIHTKGWEPPLANSFKDRLAEETKGYGGADLRALCTEASLNATQRTYPQIYMTNDKLVVDPKKIDVTAKDFMVSIKKMIPSSERSSSSGAAPLPSHIQPLLIRQLDLIKDALKTILPERKRMTVLEEAMYEDDALGADGGFERERMMQDFEGGRVYRPRLLIHGPAGMGQQYLGSAVLHHFEGVHAQSFDLATIMSDSTRSPEAAVIQLFVEVKRHKPSVIYIPNMDIWYRTLPEQVIATFKGLLQSISANDPILLLGVVESSLQQCDPVMLRDFFGFSRKDRFELTRPDSMARSAYFEGVVSHIRKSPLDFPPDPASRPKRELEQLPRAPPPPPRVLTKEEKKAQKQKDRQIKNWLKIRLNNLMEMIKQKYRRFKKPVIEYDLIKHLIDPPPPPDANIVTSDIQPERVERFRPYFEEKDNMFRVEDTLTKKTYYNLDIDVIEDRFSNGYYCTPRQFLQDLEYIQQDAELFGDKERKFKANELLTNAEVYILDVEMDAAFVAQCEEIFQREKKKAEVKHAKSERHAKALEDARSAAENLATSVHQEGADASPERPFVEGLRGIFETPGPRRNGTSSNGVVDSEASTFIHPSDVQTPAPPQGDHPPASNQQAAQVGDFQTPHFGSQFSPYQMGTQPQLSQGDTNTQLTQMLMGAGESVRVTPVMNISGVLNDASTTTSGGRPSDGTGSNSQPHSVPYSNGTSGSGSGSVLGKVDPPGFSNFGATSIGDSQLPETQEVAHSSQTPHTPSTQSYTASVTSHLGGTTSGGFNTQSQTHSASPTSQRDSRHMFTVPRPRTPELIRDDLLIERMHRSLCDRTSGYSLEQLEQANAQIMDAIWRVRSCWNRDEVAKKALAAFEEVEADIKEMQELMAASGSF